jgi:signal transduction histidine kinase
LETLQKSEAQNRALIDAIPDMMFRVSRDGTILDMHVHENNWPLVSPEAWVGKNIRQTALPSNAAEKAIESIHQALNTRAVATTDYTVMIQGEARVFESRYVASGPDEVVADVRDITERVQIRTQLEKAIEVRTHELATLLEISRHIATTLELKPLVRVILNELKAVVDYDWAALFILQGNAWTLLDHAAPALPGTLDQLDVTLEQTELTRVLTQDRKPVIVDDAHDVKSLMLTLQALGRSRAEEFVNYARAWMGIPLMVKDRVVGILTLANRQPGYYRQQHALLAQTIANQAALAIENARLYEQAQSAAVLEERRRLARELHDSVTQSLYGLTLMAETGRHLATTGALEQVEHYLARVSETAQQALKEMRVLILELRPVELEKEGLVGALQQRLDTVEKRAGIQASLLVEGTTQLTPTIEKELYRIALEALNNTLKHSNAKEVTILLCFTNEQVELTVQDNGQGFNPNLVQEHGGMGLKSLRERAERLGGRLAIRSEPGAGTTITFSMNLASHLIAWQKSERLG